MMHARISRQFLHNNHIRPNSITYLLDVNPALDEIDVLSALHNLKEKTKAVIIRRKRCLYLVGFIRHKTTAVHHDDDLWKQIRFTAHYIS